MFPFPKWGRSRLASLLFLDPFDERYPRTIQTLHYSICTKPSYSSVVWESMSTSDDEALPESVSFSESRKLFQNKLKEEKESRKAQRKRSVVRKQSSRGQQNKDSCADHAPDTQLFRQAAETAQFKKNQTVFLQKKSRRKTPRKKSKKRTGNAQVMLLRENSKLALKSSASDNPEKFLKQHFYGNRLMRSSRTDANLTRSKQLYLPSPYFYC